MTWREWLLLYAGIGLVLGVAFVLIGAYRKRKESGADALMAALEPQRKTPWYRFRERVLLPLLLILLMVPFWPVLLGIVGWDAWSSRHNKTYVPEEEKPAVLAEYLVRSVEVSEAERHGRINDPMGAVPAVPWGHLYLAWQAFLEKQQPDEELWFFKSPEDKGFYKSGYVWTKGRQLGAHFMVYRQSPTVKS